MLRISALVALVAVAVAATGCGDPREPLGTTRTALIGGSETSEAPAVGRVQTLLADGQATLCTGTLVRGRVVITAAHCMGYGTKDNALDEQSFFRVESPEGTKNFRIDRYRSFAATTGTDDLLLAHLEAAVPEPIATPAPIARQDPTAGAVVATFGYGCVSRTSLAGADVKRKVVWTFNPSSPTQTVCPGDSGGTTFDPSGAVALVTSGYFTSQGGDVFARVGAQEAALTAQMAAWGEPDAPPDPGTTPPKTTPPAATPPAATPDGGVPAPSGGPHDPPARPEGGDPRTPFGAKGFEPNEAAGPRPNDAGACAMTAQDQRARRPCAVAILAWIVAAVARRAQRRRATSRANGTSTCRSTSSKPRSSNQDG